MKKVWKRIKAFFLLFGSIIVSLFAAIFVGKFLLDRARVKTPENKKRWKAINDTTIVIMGPDNNPIKKVKLPKDPETKKQIKVKDLEAVGITKEGKVDVKIKHTVTDRRINP